ncbi:MAG TPA: zinc ribbon domain-containing protein [Candidatus Goldiibacteriota bacterium]|nr:zinc ribbon domain-containing protein [Candidatus Goldiibacteriota bacterium]
MPTYVYKCENCGEFEAKQSILDGAYKVCPKCKGNNIRRMVTNTAGFIMKSTSRKDHSADAPPSECETCSKAEECPNNHSHE